MFYINKPSLGLVKEKKKKNRNNQFQCATFLQSLGRFLFFVFVSDINANSAFFFDDKTKRNITTKIEL